MVTVCYCMNPLKTGDITCMCKTVCTRHLVGGGGWGGGGGGGGAGNKARNCVCPL